MSDERDVREVMARYVRAIDRRESAALTGMFMPDGCIEIFHNQGGVPVPIGKIEGSARIGRTSAEMMQPHPPRGWSHHTTHDAIVSIHGAKATIDLQFVVYNTVGDEVPSQGWPEGAKGAQGKISAVDAGYYHANLKRLAGGWKIAALRITHDLPQAMPPA